MPDVGTAPHLIRIDTRSGHGSGKPTTKLIEEYSRHVRVPRAFHRTQLGALS